MPPRARASVGFARGFASRRAKDGVARARQGVGVVARVMQAAALLALTCHFNNQVTHLNGVTQFAEALRNDGTLVQVFSFVV